MKEIFEKNDKWLKVARIAFLILMIVCTILILVLSILLMCTDNLGMGFGYLFGGILGVGFLGIMYALLFAYMTDVKLIRNKLYDLQKENYALLGEQTPKNISAVNDMDADKKYAMLLKLNDIYKSGAITEKEYEEQKSKLLK